MSISKRDLAYLWDMRSAALEIVEFMQGASQSAQIIGQRNVLAHDYGEILVERVWLTATRSVPEMISLLDQIIPEQNE